MVLIAAFILAVLVLAASFAALAPVYRALGDTVHGKRTR